MIYKQEDIETKHIINDRVILVGIAQKIRNKFAKNNEVSLDEPYFNINIAANIFENDLSVFRQSQNLLLLTVLVR